MQPEGARLLVPRGSKIVAFQTQRGTPTLWLDCDPGEPSVERRFCLVVTGQPHAAIEDGTYIGTVQDLMGLVFHCYEIAK